MKNKYNKIEIKEKTDQMKNSYLLFI